MYCSRLDSLTLRIKQGVEAEFDHGLIFLNGLPEQDRSQYVIERSLVDSEDCTDNFNICERRIFLALKAPSTYPNSAYHLD